MDFLGQRVTYLPWLSLHKWLDSLGCLPSPSIHGTKFPKADNFNELSNAAEGPCGFHPRVKASAQCILTELIKAVRSADHALQVFVQLLPTAEPYTYGLIRDAK